MVSLNRHPSSAAILRLAPEDVAVAVAPLAVGDEISIGQGKLIVLEPIPAGHKISLVRIAMGAPIRKYGQFIGVATQEIQAGSHVHGHNCAIGALDPTYALATAGDAAPEAANVGAAPRTFLGYMRSDGRVGTRNYLAVVSMANCSASVSRRIADGINPDELSTYPPVDGVLALTHKGGCSMPADGSEHLQLERVLAGFARHPNVALYLIVGLGLDQDCDCWLGRGRVGQVRRGRDWGRTSGVRPSDGGIRCCALVDP
jgi:altronate hydrolase